MISNNIADIVNSLKNGGIVIYPTDTVYSLSVDPFNEVAVKKIFSFKKRDKSKSLIIQISSISKLPYWVERISKKSLLLIEKFWPGPLTLIFKKNLKISSNAFVDTIGIRIPNNNHSLKILSEFRGLIGTSVNISGFPSIFDLKDIVKIFGNDVDFILGIGNCEKKKESTIIDCSSEKIIVLREGCIKNNIINDILI